LQSRPVALDGRRSILVCSHVSRRCVLAIEYRIDHEQRLVWAKGRGTLTGEDVFQYQRDVWSSPDVRGYDELMDMSEVERIDLTSVRRLKDLASLSAAMDPPTSRSRFAIVAPKDETFGLSRMYETYRRLEDKSTKQVGVFRSLAEAMEFLGRQ
jgi:hypothetical protein